MQQYKSLIESAIEARKSSYSPYSGFKVGAALICSSGKIYTGCNIENSAYSETICAERVAIYNAISQGERDFVALAIVGGKEEICSFTYPCGACRQVISELCPVDMKIVTFNGQEIFVTPFSELLPYGFNKDSIK